MRFPAFAILVILAALPAARALEVPQDCDYLIITDSLLLPEARRLSDLRAGTPFDRIAKPAVAAMGYRLVVDGGRIRFEERGSAGRRVDLKGARAK